MLVILSGILAGFIHVLSGPDHIAAVAPIAVDRAGKRWRTGAIWGIGHTAGVWIVGLGAYLLRESLPTQTLSIASERLVGIVLIGIGIWAGRKALRHKVHTHTHEHAGTAHTHIHIHIHARQTHSHSHATGGIGVLHGIAGSSHLFGVLPALGLPTWGDTFTYLIAFGFSSILAMSGFAWILGEMVKRLAHRFDVYRWILGGSATLAVVVGCVWLTI